MYIDYYITKITISISSVILKPHWQYYYFFRFLLAIYPHKIPHMSNSLDFRLWEKGTLGIAQNL